MRIEFERIEMRNFMSFAEESFDFSKCTGMSLVQGKNNDIPGSKNGAGKTQLFSSLLYALFGQLQSKIKNENLITKPAKGKDMDVSLCFSIDGKQYKIRRGISKGKSSYLTLLEITDRNEVDITKSTIQETQDHIEKNLLHCDATIFLRTILLTADQTYNFYMLKKADKKEFVEKMFDISLFEEMHVAIHKDVLSLEKDSIACQNRIAVLNKTNDDYEARKEKHEEARASKLKQLNESLDVLSKLLEDAKNTKIESNAEAISEIESKISQVQKDIDDNQSKHNSFLDEKTSLQEKEMKIDLGIHKLLSTQSAKQQIIDKHLDILEKLCNDCKKVFSQHYCLDEIEKEIISINAKIKKLEEAKSLVNSKLNDIAFSISASKEVYSGLKQSSTALNDKLRELVEESTQHAKMLLGIESKINLVNNDISNTKSASNPYVELICKCQDDITSENKSLDLTEKKLKYLKFAESIVSQDTLRKFIIKDLVVLLNNKIKTYLAKLGAKYFVVFDEDMDYEFVTPNGCCEWSNFSAGERMRIMVATSFAFRDFMSIRNSLNSNVLILDEYFDSAIDALCVESILGILKEYSQCQNQNVFVISHRPEVNADVFDRTILVEKTNSIAHIHM